MNRQTSKARVLTLATATALFITVLAPIAGHAGSEGSRNTAIGLGAAAAYLLIKGKTVPGVVTAAGAGYAYKQYADKRDDEERCDRYGRYDNRYDNRYDRRDNRYDNRYDRRDNRRDNDWRYEKRDCDKSGNGRVIFSNGHNNGRNDCKQNKRVVVVRRGR